MSEQDRNRTAVSYGRGPLLALGVMAGAVAVAGGVGAVAMTLDEEPSAVSDQSTIDSSDESSSDASSTGAQDGTSAEDPSGTDSTPASDPSDGAGQAKPSQGSAAQSPDEAGSSASAGTGAGSAASGTAAEAAPGASQQAGSSSSAAGSGRHVSEAPVDAVPPTAGSANSGPRHAMPVDGSYGVAYEIRWGDTLSEIAMDEGVSTQYLADLNAIKDPDVIYAGDPLILPVD
ncbi:UNVERIFIED_CONTAM: LysM domain-containing protein [Kocuria sp. CPCC 205295]|uniref:LysM peptidoglycan-binding domain-containing protein n=1 Tax=Kocuria TaxID=57493 RepID=UPI0034D6321C